MTKATVVPAQVTTVEDRIFADLSMPQVMLLFTVIFVSGGVFTFAEPAMEGALYKYVIMLAVGVVCGILAIRIKGKIIGLWLIILMTYCLRPKYYVYNKNVATLRETYAVKTEKQPKQKKAKTADNKPKTTQKQLDNLATARVLTAIENPDAKFRLEAGKKGGLRVRLTEIEK